MKGKITKIEEDYAIDPTRKPVVVADETNNSQEDKDNGIMNVDVEIPIIPFIKITVEIDKTLEEERKKILASVGIPKHQLNEGGIGKGRL